MTRNFVRYSPDTECGDPEFEHLQTVKRHIEGSVDDEGIKLWPVRHHIGGENNLEKVDTTSMAPWRVTVEHRRPLGNIQRAREELCLQLSVLRHQLNHQVCKEPKNLAEVSGS
jgi:hypothetical protein